MATCVFHNSHICTGVVANVDLLTFLVYIIPLYWSLTKLVMLYSIDSIQGISDL